MGFHSNQKNHFLHWAHLAKKCSKNQAENIIFFLEKEKLLQILFHCYSSTKRQSVSRNLNNYKF